MVAQHGGPSRCASSFLFKVVTGEFYVLCVFPQLKKKSYSKTKIGAREDCNWNGEEQRRAFHPRPSQLKGQSGVCPWLFRRQPKRKENTLRSSGKQRVSPCAVRPAWGTRG